MQKDKAMVLAAARKEKIENLEAINSELQKKYNNVLDKQDLLNKQSTIEIERDFAMNTIVDGIKEWTSRYMEPRTENEELLLQTSISGSVTQNLGRNAHSAKCWRS